MKSNCVSDCRCFVSRKFEGMAILPCDQCRAQARTALYSNIPGRTHLLPDPVLHVRHSPPHADPRLVSVRSQIRQWERKRRAVVMGADWHSCWRLAIHASLIGNDFSRSVRLIAQDDDAGWCGIANAPIIQDRNGLSYCAIAMPEYQAPEEPAAE